MDISLQLQRDEGFVPHVYTDTVGKATIGFGHNLIAKPVSWIGGATVITREQALAILANDIAETKNGLALHLPWFNQLDDARSGVLINMAFNIGVDGVCAFKHMLANIVGRQWDAAAKEMQNSLWYHQVGVRAQRLQKQMITGTWQ